MSTQIPKDTCPRRVEQGLHLENSPFVAAGPGKDAFVTEDTCPFCGSMHPDKFMELLETQRVLLGPTDKNYKVYTQQTEGTTFKGTKFYFQHLSEEQKRRFIELLNEKRILFQENSEGFYNPPYFCVRVPSTPH